MQFNFFWSTLLSPSSHRWDSPLRILALQILPRYLILENLTCDILSCWSVPICVHMFMYTCVCALSLSRVWLFVASWTVAYQAALSMGFSSKNTGVGCHFLLQGIFLIRGSNLISCVSWIAGEFFTSWTLGEASLLLGYNLSKSYLSEYRHRVLCSPGNPNQVLVPALLS